MSQILTRIIDFSVKWLFSYRFVLKTCRLVIVCAYFSKMLLELFGQPIFTCQDNFASAILAQVTHPYIQRMLDFYILVKQHAMNQAK